MGDLVYQAEDQVMRGLSVLMRRTALGWELFERRDVVP